MDEILKNVIFHGPHMPGIDLSPVPVHFIFLPVQPTPTASQSYCSACTSIIDDQSLLAMSDGVH